MTSLFILIFLLGLAIGSFLNCLIWRLYQEETILGRSYCPSCKKKISWNDNIPLLSFIILKGRCRYCQKRISWQYPLVELATAIFFLLSFYFFIIAKFSFSDLLISLILISFLVIFFVFDTRWQLLPSSTLFFGIILFAAFALFIKNVSLLNLLLLILAGSGFFALQFFLSKGKWIGEGDIWLGAFLALAFPNFKIILLIILLTYIIGGLVASFLLLARLKKFGSQIPLGTFMVLAALVVLFLGENLLAFLGF